MDKTILFSETQRFRQWWIWALLLLVNALMGYGLFKQLYLGQPWGDQPMGNTGLIMVAALVLAVTLLIYSIKLETFLRVDGIHVRFFPIHIKFRQYTWDTIRRCYVRHYDPLSEFGGWGIRWGFGNGKAFNVSGNKGLQIEFRDNKKLLIGTRKYEELKNVLETSGKAS